MQIKLKEMDTRLERIERVMANQSLLDVSNQLEALRSDVRAMHNDVDQLSNALESGRKQQRDLYADLDQRMKNLEARGSVASAPGAASGNAPAAGAAAAGAPAAAAAGASSDSGEDKSSYQAAFNLLKDGQYDRAIVAFQKFLTTYPDSSLADNAQYWLGEAYYVTHDYDNAVVAFRAVGEQYPQSPKVPDALVKLGLTQIDQKKLVEARVTLKQVVQRFPGTDAAKLATTRLQTIPPDEH